ncbi:di-trans,poly-cis-decaprenylcistransferase [Candidatus Competibacter phosphatis]|uniref:Ditrans,polycis-undecaprenyl-diphosphate synthase ((2E,6E)-farnesyl-diphosphate specific) n=1 Tax=Candidatus Competibacter phosphatis TaxID=221280 RepID=A0ABX1TMI3_9GAMM|nr:polyprenyl diphosphate synthase [Candidatus Competibacter phosphatis]NMQ20588.1 di-trans,poly-cis-decaprenylcistransferase [Candidatus Competibacter phosphatis]
MSVDVPMSRAPCQPLPRHIAIVMDGNGRWAQQRSLPRTAGHREGAKAVRRIVRACSERDIEVLTLFAFSSENWRRPRPEVEVLLKLFLTTLRGEIRRLDTANVRLRFIGDYRAFPENLQDYIVKAERRTAANTGLTLVIAANYGGRWDLAQAARRVSEAVLEGRLQPGDITPAVLHSFTCLSDLPEPDLFIRTGGEQRISNFLLWQMAYAELYFTDRLWPDYDDGDLESACAAFASRQRRFGRTAEQVAQNQHA